MNLTLQRISQSTECTLGVITLEDTRLYTLELPWVPEVGFPGGEPDRSCVPAGLYELALHDTAAHPKTFALVNISLGVIHEPDSAFPNARTACLLHVANRTSDLEGCIGLGTSANECTIGNSQYAFAEFKAAVPWVAGHTLMIIDPL
jgi:Family of unknown function (DUF5675)